LTTPPLPPYFFAGFPFFFLFLFVCMVEKTQNCLYDFDTIFFTYTYT